MGKRHGKYRGFPEPQIKKLGAPSNIGWPSQTVTWNRSATLLLKGESESSQVCCLPGQRGFAGMALRKCRCSECAPKHLSNATRQVHKFIDRAFANRPPSVMMRGSDMRCILQALAHILQTQVTAKHVHVRKKWCKHWCVAVRHMLMCKRWCA